MNSTFEFPRQTSSIVAVVAAAAERYAKHFTFHTTCLHMQCNFPFELLTLILGLNEWNEEKIMRQRQSFQQL